jgi:O-antigen/teichoic acid export membrane protein
LASLKNLAGQTLWYGLSSIAARFIGYLQTPIITYLLQDRAGQAAYGEFSVLYAGISLANILFTYGMETAFFRYASKGEDKQQLFQTAFSSLLVSTFLLSIVFILFRQPLANAIDLSTHPEYITWSVIVIAFDTLSTIPFARLRQEGRPRKYAFVRISGIVLNLILTVFFLYFSQQYVNHNPDTAYAHWFLSHSKGGLLILPNMAGSILTFLLLFAEWKDFRFEYDKTLWLKLWRYGSPMIIVGLGGMINETMDRVMLERLHTGSIEIAKVAVGIYSANYKIAIFITLFIQAFKMAAEPFFFNQSNDKNAPATYARIMKWFTITLCIAFLFTSLYLDIWQYMVPKSYRSGLAVVPILLFANICLGIYYNLSVWYKITDNMRKGMYITLIGAVITLVLNFAFIPEYGMMACAWATCICYFTMMVLSYFWGKRHFPVPYPVRKIVMYIGMMLLLFGLQQTVNYYLPGSFVLHLISGTALMLVFLTLILTKEKEELKKMPLIGKYL